jgi:hypothetical protein
VVIVKAAPVKKTSLKKNKGELMEQNQDGLEVKIQ